jgi:hypothetical protein
LIVKQAKVQGFLVSRYAERFPEGLEQLAGWLKQGKLKYREDVAQGIEAAPQAFIGMLQGKTQGNQLVQLSELQSGARKGAGTDNGAHDQGRGGGGRDARHSTAVGVTHPPEVDEAALHVGVDELHPHAAADVEAG